MKQSKFREQWWGFWILLRWQCEQGHMVKNSEFYCHLLQ
jgi:hypothetical protein